MSRKIGFQVYMSSDLHEAVKSAAEAQRLSVSELARTLLEQWLRQQTKKSA